MRLRGFSLIELMVSMVLLALMGVLLMTSVNSSITSKESIEEISDRYHVVRAALSRMSREISMAYLSKHINLSDPAYITQFKGRRTKLFFSAFGNVVRQKDAKESDEQVIGYYLAQDKNGVQSLMRRHQANLNLDVEKGGRSQVLCPNVSKLEFFYYDGSSNKWDEEWIADPSSLVLAGSLGQVSNQPSRGDYGQQPKVWRLPQAVKIEMTVEMTKGNTIKWVSESQVQLKEPLDLK